MAASDYVPKSFNYRLLPAGRPQMGKSKSPRTRTIGMIMLLTEIAVALWVSPMAVICLAAAPATISFRYRRQLKRWLIG